MPEVNVDDSKWEQYRQCEIRRPSGTDATSYFYHIVWIHVDIGKKGNTIVDREGNTWTVAETYGVKRMPTAQIDLRERTQ